MALTVEEIEEVMGGPAKPPIRVFVGLESRPTTSERADLAMRELEALGGLERSHIVFMSPTGTGYLNYVTAESLEFLTRGDVALVAMQYSLRPSPLSLGRVADRDRPEQRVPARAEVAARRDPRAEPSEAAHLR